MKLVTPEGTAVYPHLNEPDTKFNADGEYSTKLSVSSETANSLIEVLESFYEEAYKDHCKEQNKQKLKKHNHPWTEETDEDGNDTGNVVFKFKMKAKTRTGIVMRPILVDSETKPLENKIGSGSKLKVSFEARSWYVPALGVGVTLRLRGVQVINLVEWTGGSSVESLGFSKEQGFVSETVVESEEFQKETSDSSDF